MNRHVVAAVAVFALASVARAQEKEGGASPQDVFDQGKAASTKGNWKALFLLMDPEERDVMAMMLMMGVGMSVEAHPEGKADVEAIWKKYGIDPNEKKKVDLRLEDKEEMRRVARDFLKDVKDKAGLCGDLMGFMSRGEKSRAPIPEKAVFKDLKVDGDRATGTVDNGDGKSRPLYFIKRGDRWFVTEDRGGSAPKAKEVEGAPTVKAPQGEPPAKVQETPPPLASPQAVFDKAKEAGEKENWKAVFSLIDPPDRDVLVFMTFFMAGMQAGNNKEAGKEIEEIARKHNVKDDDKSGDVDITNKAAVKKAAHEAMKGVKDKPGLFADLMDFVKKHDKDGQSMKSGPKSWVGAELKDLKVDGEKASGTVVYPDKKTKPLGFMKRKDHWYILLD